LFLAHQLKKAYRYIKIQRPYIFPKELMEVKNITLSWRTPAGRAIWHKKRQLHPGGYNNNNESPRKRKRKIR
jgi:hypothetical protein